MTTRRTTRPLALLGTGLLLLAGLIAPAAATAAPPSTVRLPNGIQPEGITSYGSTFWVGSLRDGRIVTGDLREGGATRLLLPGATGRQLRGLAFDPRTDLLWVAGNVGEVGHVFAVNALSGRIERDVVVDGAGFLNDLFVAGDAVWVTDSLVDRLTRIALDADGAPTAVSPAFLPLRGAWPGAPEGENAANGIEPIDATRVLLDNSTVGGLRAVDLRTGVARQVAVSGGPGLTGGDGLERRGSTLWVVRGIDDASVSQLRLSVTPRAVSATYQATLTDPTLDVPSTATFTLGGLYAVNARFGNPSPATASYAATRLPVTAGG